MMLFTGGVKTFSILTEHIFKSEALYTGFSTMFTRTLVTKSVLLNRNFIKKIDEPIYHKSLNESQNLGEIIDLNVEFDDVKIDNKKTKKKRKIKEKNVKLNNNVDTENENFTKIEMNDSIQIPKENNLKESDKSFVVEKRFNDTKKNSRILSSTILNLKSAKLRKKRQEIILEGKRLIHDAISAGFSPSKIFFSRISDLEKLNLPENIPLYKVLYENLKLWSDVVTAQGVMAVFDMPNLNTLKNNANTIPLTIICDNIRDPGNLGSILRIAAGVGCEKLILAKGCADIWESKVLRAGAGAHFRIPIINNLQWSDLRREIREDSKIILADFSGCLTFNEASENKNDSENKTSNFKNRKKMSESLPSHCYYSVKYGKENAVIIVGGETQGISDEAYEFGVERKGIRVFIPMSNEIESLNSSVALGILTYEFRRQFDFICGKEVSMQEVNSGNFKNEAC